MDAKCDIDTEFALRFEKAQRQGQRKPRNATLVKHSSARRVNSNIFTWGIPDLQTGELTWGFRHPGREDFARVQNMSAARDRDMLDEANMSKGDRAEVLSTGTYQELFGRFAAAARQQPEFNTAATKHGHGKDDDDDDFLDDTACPKVEEKSEHTPRAKQPKDSLSPSSARASTQASATALDAGGRPPLLVVAVGLGNGNSAVGALKAFTEGHRIHYLGIDLSTQAVEFVRRRVATGLFESWFQGKLPGEGKPAPIPDPLALDNLRAFDAAPLVISKGAGRLTLPSELLAPSRIARRCRRTWTPSVRSGTRPTWSGTSACRRSRRH